MPPPAGDIFSYRFLPWLVHLAKLCRLKPMPQRLRLRTRLQIFWSRSSISSAAFSASRRRAVRAFAQPCQSAKRIPRRCARSSQSAKMRPTCPLSRSSGGAIRLSFNVLAAPAGFYRGGSHSASIPESKGCETAAYARGEIATDTDLFPPRTCAKHPKTFFPKKESWEAVPKNNLMFNQT